MQKRAISITSCFAAFVCGGFQQGVAGEASDICKTIPVLASKVSLVLKEVHLSKDGWFFGTFELSNVGLDSKLILRGTREGGVFMPSYPSYAVQFLDLTGRWVSLGKLQGSFVDPYQLEIDVHSRRSFSIDLMSQEDADKNASDFRIVLVPSQPDICVISHQFHGVPKRPQVTGFEQDSSR